jgi:ABC-2 type transport system ATP-binding protein
MLDLVGLHDKADRRLKGFSGGERQRLGIAQAQIAQPALLILDEPAAALDPIGRKDVLDIMEQLREETTVFYSTHILDDVQRVSDTVAILNQGEVIAQGPIERLLNGEEGPIYQVTLRGDDSAAYDRLIGRPWIRAIEITRDNGTITWQISVRDEGVAESRLMPLLVEGGDVTVRDFRKKTNELEDIFMKLVEA